MTIDEEKAIEDIEKFETRLISLCDQNGREPERGSDRFEEFEDVSERLKLMRKIVSRHQAQMRCVPRRVFVSAKFKNAAKPMPIVADIINWTGFRWDNKNLGPLTFQFGSSDVPDKVKELIIDRITQSDIFLALVISKPSSFVFEEFGMSIPLAKPSIRALLESAQKEMEEAELQFGRIMQRWTELPLENPPPEDLIGFDPMTADREPLVPRLPEYSSQKDLWTAFNHECLRLTEQQFEYCNWLDNVAGSLIKHLERCSEAQANEVATTRNLVMQGLA